METETPESGPATTALTKTTRPTADPGPTAPPTVLRPTTLETTGDQMGAAEDGQPTPAQDRATMRTDPGWRTPT
jgi:hypothetical protein